MKIKLTLPMAPSINNYYMRRGTRTFILPKGVKFRKEVNDIVREAGLDIMLLGRLKMTVVIHFGNKRKNDIDNRIKALWDSLEKSMVFLNDEAFDQLHIFRGEVDKNNPRMEIEIEEIDQ